ncbi:MAG: ComF family protein [Deltaproteobacteria bacterium]|nr:ComF family protein [Deltaproteobacteria bacterium]
MLWRHVAALLWPARCAGCNAFVPEGVSFCPSCEVSIVSLGVCCPGCAMPVDAFGACQGCQKMPLPFARAQAALAYGGALAQALLRWKHGGQRHVARSLAGYLAPLLARAADQGAEIACPVPLHPRRLRDRGFNQALDLLRAARPRVASIAIACDALARTVDTPSLGHGTPAQRRRIVANAFAVARPGKIEGKHVLLVDDVMTTGATLAECSRVLLEAGAKEVAVTVLARAI